MTVPLHRNGGMVFGNNETFLFSFNNKEKDI